MKVRVYENLNRQPIFFQVIAEQLLRVYQVAAATVQGCLLLDQVEVGEEGVQGLQM